MLIKLQSFSFCFHVGDVTKAPPVMIPCIFLGLVCKGERSEVDKEGFGGLAGEVGRDKGDNGGGACSGIVWFTTPPPTPPRPSSLRGIELLEPCSDLKITVFLCLFHD